MITQLISTKMCRKVGYKLFTSSGNRQQSAGVPPPTKKTVPTVTYAWGSVTQQHLWGEQIKSSMHTVVLNSHSGPQESSVQLPLRNRKWRKCCYDWLKLGRSVGSLSPIGRTPEPMIYFFPTAAADQQAFFNNLFSARWIIEARAWLQFGIFRHKLE